MIRFEIQAGSFESAFFIVQIFINTKEIRKQHGIKLEELATALKVSRQTIGSLEKERYKIDYNDERNTIIRNCEKAEFADIALYGVSTGS